MESLVQRYQGPAQEPQACLTGGWVGFLSYEFGYMKEPRLAPLCPVPSTPLLFAGFYLWAASHNRTTDTYHLWIHPECPEGIRSKLQQWQLSKPLANATSLGEALDWKMASPFKARQPAQEFVDGVG